MTDRGRRNLLWLGGIATAYLALANAPALWRRAFPKDFDFAPVSGLPGFRRIDRADISAGSPALIGLDAQDAPPSLAEDLRPDPCPALFGAPWRPGMPVPVAYFADIRCPYCRVLTPLLIDRAAGRAPTIRLTFHELPLLGPGSVLAARAALAAAEQDAASLWHERVTATSFVPTRAYLLGTAEEIGLDASRLSRAMEAPSIDRRLAISRGLADLFGFPGTPALVIGRTAVLGRIEPADLDRLIALERDEAETAPCT